MCIRDSINAHLKPYPWEPGTVLRYRDQDFHLLGIAIDAYPVSYTHLRAHETVLDLVCRLLLEKKKT